MKLREAVKFVRPEHVKQAADLVNLNGLDWLYDRTGRQRPQYRYIVVDNDRFPSMAFGYLVAQIAGNTDVKSNDLNVNQAVAPIKRFGFIEIDGPAAADSEGERAARSDSYYRQLARPQQANFRRAVRSLYKNRCAITGCDVVGALEAAHIEQFAIGRSNVKENGLLLRVDLHKLFDFGLLAIDQNSLSAHFSSVCLPHYAPFDGRIFERPSGGPRPEAFQPAWKIFNQQDST